MDTELTNTELTILSLKQLLLKMIKESNNGTVGIIQSDIYNNILSYLQKTLSKDNEKINDFCEKMKALFVNIETSSCVNYNNSEQQLVHYIDICGWISTMTVEEHQTIVNLLECVFSFP